MHLDTIIPLRRMMTVMLRAGTLKEVKNLSKLLVVKMHLKMLIQLRIA